VIKPDILWIGLVLLSEVKVLIREYLTFILFTWIIFDV